MIDTLNIGIRFALYVNLMLLFGLPLFGLYAFKRAERLQSNVLPLRSAVVWFAVAAIALSILSILAMTASMAGVALLVNAAMLGSLGVIGAAIAIWLTGKTWIDPIVAIGIGLWVTTHILLQAFPRGFDLKAIRAANR